MARTVAIACYPSLGEPGDGWSVVGVDVIRATTTAITAVAAGRRCFPVSTLEEAVALAARLEDPLLVGELGGSMPFGFHLQNSPVAMSRRADLERPVILLSTSGTALLLAAAARGRTRDEQAGRTYAACLRNVRAQTDWLIAHDENVLLLAGESRGEFREEDRLCCARLAHPLLEAGYQPGNRLVEETVEQWAHAPDDAFVSGHSVQYLAATGQLHDVEFILNHVDDLDTVYEMRAGELIQSGRHDAA